MNKQTPRSAKILAESEIIRKSVKNLTIDAKATPKKFYSSTADKDKLSNNFFLLKKKEVQSQTNVKQQIQDQVINSKLLEPLIEENIRKKNKGNTSKKKLKPDDLESIEKKEEFPILLESDKPFMTYNNIEKQLDLDKNIHTEGKTSKSKLSKKKFGNEKRFSFNTNEILSEETVTLTDKDNYKKNVNSNTIYRDLGNYELLQTNFPNENSDLKTCDIINTILSKADPKNKLTSFFPKSKTKYTSGNTSKSKTKIVTKRRLDNLTFSDEEKFAASSKRKKNIR
jgi:hypothetical protein